MGIFCLGPVSLIYNGTIWKDVFFSNLSLLGFALLAVESPNKWRLLMSALSFSLVILVRQQGLLIAVLGSLCFATLHGTASLKRKIFLFFGAFFVLILLSKLFSALILYSGAEVFTASIGTGFAVLLLYDISGMAFVAGPNILKVFEENKIDIQQFMAEIISHYSDSRQDFLQLDDIVHRKIDFSTLFSQWLFAVSHDPVGYLTHRLNVFLWFLGAQDPRACAPVHLGVSGPAPLISEMGLDVLSYPYKQWLWSYAEYFFDTLMFRPWFYLICALAIVGTLIRQLGTAQNRALFMLLTASTAYVGSYYFFSMACDFRYSYLLVAATFISLALVIPKLIKRNFN